VTLQLVCRNERLALSPWALGQQGWKRVCNFDMLVIGQSCIHHSLTPLALLKTSASYSMNTSLFLTRSHLSPNLAITMFAVSVHTLTPKQVPPSPLPLFTPRLTTATLYHSLPTSQITRLQQIQNSLARAVVKAPKSSHITPIIRSLHWLKIAQHIEYKLLSLTYKVLTTTQPILTCSRKPTWVSLIYRTEPTTKKSKTEKLKSKKTDMLRSNRKHGSWFQRRGEAYWKEWSVG